MQLLGEEINTQVSVLSGRRRGGDSDDLAWSTLKDQEIAQADVVCRDGDGVGDVGRLGDRHTARCRTGGTSTAYGNVNLFLSFMTMMISTIQNTVGSIVYFGCCSIGNTVEIVAERVVMT